MTLQIGFDVMKNSTFIKVHYDKNVAPLTSGVYQGVYKYLQKTTNVNQNKFLSLVSRPFVIQPRHTPSKIKGGVSPPFSWKHVHGRVTDNNLQPMLKLYKI